MHFWPTCVILLWFARNMDKFWDSWMDEGSDIFLRNWAALGKGKKQIVIKKLTPGKTKQNCEANIPIGNGKAPSERREASWLEEI